MMVKITLVSDEDEFEEKRITHYNYKFNNSIKSNKFIVFYNNTQITILLGSTCHYIKNKKI